MKSDIEIARAATLRPIVELAGDRLGIPADALTPYGHDKAKVSLDYLDGLSNGSDGKLILMTAISPTRAGEGKTTTTVGLGDALNRIGKKAAICLREPSLGPVFGVKGGAAGGGYSQVVPMEDINLHFTGDMHAISTANNLLAAMIDNDIYWNGKAGIDPRRISWRRVLDMNDRALRHITVGLGGPSNGFPREDGFDIAVASEVMAIFCLADGLDDLRRRLGNIVVGQTRRREPVRASDLGAEGAMTALLLDALQPNLVQTLENNPAFVHGGPFANIAHGCNSVLATRAALKLADYVVTEAGFGADLGAEKFFNIKCRKAGLSPDCAVLVASIRALKMHGGLAKADLEREDLGALREGAANLRRHVANIRKFGVPIVVAINRFDADTPDEVQLVSDICGEIGVEAILCSHWADGSAGAEDLAHAVVRTIEDTPANFSLLYADGETLWNKTQFIARSLYGADEIIADKTVRRQFRDLEENGFGAFPICMAKTQFSFSTDPNLMGAPSNHAVPIRELRIAAGAEFLVVVCGDIMRMPGLPRAPAAQRIGVDAAGNITGLS